MEAKHIVAMAEQLDVRPGFALSIGQEVAKKMPHAISDAVSSIRPGLKPGGETVMANKVSRYVEKTTKQARKRLFGD